ncbi:haloacid dehalogenase type II [Alkalicoccus halolimnae]|uniref:Haloacid dehalogenase type II n=1 Tax=Alkalicoccus halolimnae TaxID=1667239 RepID=A0A5C7F2C9_9BACI|nr:haloacid dehalogenase type II [Alkalicoccus halolimnae]TXF82750.1 haloacid dehalogenase type II [Alkalicoccus halolimnae]
MHKVIMYDAYGTLYDVTSTEKTLQKYFPDKAESIGAVWRKKQIEYAFIRQMTGIYKPFSEVTADALAYSLKANGENPGQSEFTSCIKAYEMLELFPESEEVLSKQTGALNAVVSNGSKDMLEPLIEGSVLLPYLESIVSVDDIKQFKPSQTVYQYAMNYFQVERKDVLFVSSNSWDIIGANTFGFDTLWVNRGGAPFEEGYEKPDYTGENLYAVLDIENAEEDVTE